MFWVGLPYGSIFTGPRGASWISTLRRAAMRAACGPCARLVAVGDRQLLGGEERDDLGALGGGDHRLLGVRRRDPVGPRAGGLGGGGHSRAGLRRVCVRVHAGEGGPLVVGEPAARAESAAG